MQIKQFKQSKQIEGLSKLTPQVDVFGVGLNLNKIIKKLKSWVKRSGKY